MGARHCAAGRGFAAGHSLRCHHRGSNPGPSASESDTHPLHHGGSPQDNQHFRLDKPLVHTLHMILWHGNTVIYTYIGIGMSIQGTLTGKCCRCVPLVYLGNTGAFVKLPWVDLGLPPVRSNSFDVIPGAHPGQPPVPCLWSGSLGGWPQEHDVTTRVVSDRSFSSFRVSTAG